MGAYGEYSSRLRNFRGFKLVTNLKETKEAKCKNCEYACKEIQGLSKSVTTSNNCTLLGASTQLSINGDDKFKNSTPVWEQINVDRYIKDIIVNGYKLPFKDLPCTVVLRNNKSAREKPFFCM